MLAFPQRCPPPYLTPVVPTRKKRIPSVIFPEIFSRLISSFESNPSMEVHIMEMAKRYGVQHRRIYDFFNLLTHFGVCRNLGKGRMSWLGSDRMEKYLDECFMSVEKESIGKTMEEIFILEESPSLGAIATHILKLFMYLGRDTLHLRGMVCLFSHGSDDTKSLERRVYLVLNMLEILKIISHGNRIGEYTLTHNFERNTSFVFAEKLVEIRKTDKFSSLALLNTFPEQLIAQIRRQRGEAYHMLTALAEK